MASAVAVAQRACQRAWTRSISRLELALTAGMRAHDPILLSLIATLALSAYFLLIPGVDIVSSQAFHRPDAGFFLAQEPALKLLRRSSTWVMGLILAAVIVRLAVRLVRGRPCLASTRRSWFLLAGLAAGPGLVVNSLLKNEWGRPRPVHLERFGGDAPYQPVWAISDWCDRNCSFVSGEGSSAAWMVAAALVATPARWRPWAVGAAAAYAAALSLNRLAFGGHFLSDILLSWSLTGLVLAALHRVMVAAPGAARRVRRRRAPVPAAA